MKQLLIATRSKGKFPEIVHMLDGLGFEIVNLNDVPGLPSDFDVAETAMTLEGNALIKAFTLAHKTGLLTLADDSGLFVDALDGRPGVLSARYAPGTDSDRCAKLLDELAGVPEEKRTARFRTVIAIVEPGVPSVRTCEGVMEGRIADTPNGEHGFGYDSVFVSTKIGKRSAEVTLEEKSAVSHRAKALQEARTLLAEFL